MSTTLLPEGILPPLVTPFLNDRFDPDAFVWNIERLNATRLAGYVVLGSNGEGVFLSDGEAEEVLSVAASARDPAKLLVAGTGRESTARTVELSRRAVHAGADAVLVAPPSYYQSAMTEAALDHHYRTVADSVEVPVILYHIPKYAPVRFSPGLVLDLARHPNIAGLKDTSGDLVFLSYVLRDRSPSFRVYIGPASQLLAGVTLGANGGIHALANIAPDECVELFHLARDRDHLAAARELQFRLLPVNQAITARFGVAGLKQAMNLLGWRGGEPRRPLVPLSPEEITELGRVLEAGEISRTEHSESP